MDFGGFLIRFTRGSTKPSTSEKNSVAICWGLNLRLTGLFIQYFHYIEVQWQEFSSWRAEILNLNGRTSENL